MKRGLEALLSGPNFSPEALGTWGRCPSKRARDPRGGGQAGQAPHDVPGRDRAPTSALRSSRLSASTVGSPFNPRPLWIWAWMKV
jgi:hypothetical protein